MPERLLSTAEATTSNYRTEGPYYPCASNKLSAAANRAANLIRSIPGGAEITVLAGPVCDGELVRWKVSYEGQTGWTPESDGQTYFIALD